MFWIIILSFIVLVAVAIVIYTLPSDSPTKVAKKKAKELKAQRSMEAESKAEATKDWKMIAERWEKQNNNLLGDLEKIKMHQKDLEKNLEQHKVHEKDILEKLSQEKSWREKEQVHLDKAKANEKELKAQIIRTEADLEKEHSLRIRIEQQLLELKARFDSQQDEKRAATTKAMSLETTLEAANKELKLLRQENKDLSRKKEDIQWVAKTDYEELKKQFKQVEQELARMKNPPAA